MTTSYSPELNYQAGKPKFNGDPKTLFEGGAIPDGWQTMNAADAAAPADDGGAAAGVSIVDASSLLPDGGTGIATTALTGGGSGCTVELVVTSGMAQLATVVDGGADYEQGDRLSVTGYEGVVLVVTGTSD